MQKLSNNSRRVAVNVFFLRHLFGENIAYLLWKHVKEAIFMKAFRSVHSEILLRILRGVVIDFMSLMLLH
jgi:hypothetical protein